MNYLQQLFQIIIDPELTTISLYDSPRMREAFAVVSAYALFTSLDAFCSAYIQTDTFSVGLLSFLVFRTHNLFALGIAGDDLSCCR